jgi:hypothetical protein
MAGETYYISVSVQPVSALFSVIAFHFTVNPLLFQFTMICIKRITDIPRFMNSRSTNFRYKEVCLFALVVN